MENLGTGGPVVTSQNVDKGFATLTMNINRNFYMEKIKYRAL